MKKIINNFKFLILSTGLMAMSIYSSEGNIVEVEETEEVTKEVEEVTEYIQDLTKNFSKFDGFFEAYQNPETSEIYLCIKQ